MALKKISGKTAMKKASSKKNSDSQTKRLPLLGFGALFGYFLSKSGATDYDTIINMFRPQNVHIDHSPAGLSFHLESLQLYGVIGVAIAVIALGLLLLESSGKTTRSGKPLDWEPLKWDTDRLMGSFIFGAGWALSGACPGTSLAQLGEGKCVALFTVIGILAGVWAYRKYRPKAVDKEQVC